MADICLVTGGCRSGKSVYAEEYVLAQPGKKIYLATSPHLDAEMHERISKHQERRDKQIWTTIEETTDLAAVFCLAQPGENYLVECVTMWINNLLFQQPDFTATDLDQEWVRVAAALEGFAGKVIFVTNEIGMGIVPDNALSRHFRDLVGNINRKIAAIAGRVVLVVAGLPLVIKA